MRSLILLSFGVSLMAQDPTPGWHRFGERSTGSPNTGSANTADQGQVAPGQQAPPPGYSTDQQPYPAQQPYSAQQPYPAQQPQNQQYPPQQYPPQQYPPQQPRYEMPRGPVDLTIAPGTWITVRINEPISTERAQAGDAFLGTLAQPIVVNGLVVARRGQTVQGRVTDVLRAGRVKGTSRLEIQITEVSLVDGQQIPVNTQFIERHGDTSVAEDLGAIGITSGIGAAIGAVAGGGWGAGIGALAGAAVGTTGILSSRGRDTVLFPEQALTFRLESPVYIVSQASGAFQPGSPADYERPTRFAQAPRLGRPAYAAYPPAYSSYYDGPSIGTFGFYSGPGFYYGRGGYSRGYGRRW